MKCIKLLTTICALSFLLGSCDSVNDSVSKKKEELSVDISTDKMEYGPETDKQVSVTIANHSAESIFLDPSARGPYNTMSPFKNSKMKSGSI